MEGREANDGLPRNCRECPNLRPDGEKEQANWSCAVLTAVRDDCFVFALALRRQQEHDRGILGPLRPERDPFATL